MRLAGKGPPLHLTYCSNIHPAETWEEVLANLRTHTLVVKARVCPMAPFGLGLRLSARAAQRLAEPDVLEDFRAFLAANDLYVFTINGFPYGAFHGTAVKERVYLPDWRQDERLRYSDQLATILAALLPTGVDGSVSTVPGCFRELGGAPGAVEAIVERLRRHAVTLWRLREDTGKNIGLALEPEPHCLLETTAEAVAFFERHLFSRAGVAAFAALTGLPPARADEALRRHLGVCFDACHAAVEFESPDEALDQLVRAGIAILKVQVSAGLQVAPADAAARSALRAFADEVYLHQVVARDANPNLSPNLSPISDPNLAPNLAPNFDPILRRHVDLPQALAEAEAPGARDGEEWRVHFHVPLFREQLGPFRNTQAFLVPLLARLGRTELCRQLEVETYTWDVLPEEYRREPVTDAIVRELEWTAARLGRRLGGPA